MLPLNQEEKEFFANLRGTAAANRLIDYIQRMIDFSLNARNISGPDREKELDARIKAAEIMEENLINRLRPPIKLNEGNDNMT